MFSIPSRCRLLVLLLSVAFLVGCQGDESTTDSKPETKPGTAPAAGQNTPALSPGVMVATATIGGVAGVADVTQVTWDWKLITVRSFGKEGIRTLNGKEQMSLRAVLKEFRHLKFSVAGGMADGMSTETSAVGTGGGDGSKEHAAELAKLLQEFSKVPEAKAKE